MIRQIKIGNRMVGDNHPPFVIAEVGINHNGNLKTAMRMVDAAKRAGAECIKFQYHIPDKEMIKNNTIPGNAKESIWKIIKKNHLSEHEEEKLFHYVKKKKLIYLSTPFSKEAAIKLFKLGVDAFKIGSGECNNYPLIDIISSFKSSKNLNRILLLGDDTWKKLYPPNTFLNRSDFTKSFFTKDITEVDTNVSRHIDTTFDPTLKHPHST